MFMLARTSRQEVIAGVAREHAPAIIPTIPTACWRARDVPSVSRESPVAVASSLLVDAQRVTDCVTWIT